MSENLCVIRMFLLFFYLRMVTDGEYLNGSAGKMGVMFWILILTIDFCSYYFLFFCWIFSILKLAFFGFIFLSILTWFSKKKFVATFIGGRLPSLCCLPVEKVASGIFLKKYHVSLFLVNILKILQKLSRHVLIHFYFRRPATNICGNDMSK